MPAYQFGRVIRLKQADVDAFIEAARAQPGTLKQLYPETVAKPDEDARNEDG